MQRCSNLADKVLWDGEGAISIRRLLSQEEEAKSTFGNASALADDDDEWELTYICQKSFRKMFPTDQVPKRFRWMQRLRQRRVIAAPHLNSIDRCVPLATKRTKDAIHRGHEAVKVEGANHHSIESSPRPVSHDYMQTRLDQVDGSKLLVRQNARVFRRSSNSVVAGDALRCLSSITTFGHGSLRHIARPDWGDLPMLPNERQRWTHDDNSIEDTESGFFMTPDTQHPSFGASPGFARKVSISSTSQGEGNFYHMAAVRRLASLDNTPYLTTHQSVLGVRSIQDKVGGKKKPRKQTGILPLILPFRGLFVHRRL